MPINYSFPLTFVELDFTAVRWKEGYGTCTEAQDWKLWTPYTAPVIDDTDNYEVINHTFIFHQPSPYTKTITNGPAHSYPTIEDLSVNPPELQIALGLGRRLNGKISFSNTTADLAEIDPYAYQRARKPFEKGLFWQKLIAINPYLRGSSLRIKRGFAGMDYEDFTTEHLLLDGLDDDLAASTFSVNYVDQFRWLDSDQNAQCPKPSTGQVLSDFNAGASSFTLMPSGIGNAEYPSSGYVCVNKEIMSFSRSGDTMTISRAQYGTIATDHKSGDGVQLCVRYNNAKSSEIVVDLLTNYSSVPNDWIDAPTWESVDDTYIDRVYSTILAKPEKVNILVTELSQQAGFTLICDSVNQNIEFQPLKELPFDAPTITDDYVMQGTFKCGTQQDKLITSMSVLFGLSNYTSQLNDAKSYRSVAYKTSSDSAAPTDINKEIFSRWIPQNGYDNADYCADLFLNRYQSPPRKYSYQFLDNPNFPHAALNLGSGHFVFSRHNTDPYGEPVLTPCRVTSIARRDGVCLIKSEEVTYVADGSKARTFTITSDQISGVNLRAIHDANKITAPAEFDHFRFVISPGIKVSTLSTGSSWPASVTLDLIVMQGAGIYGIGGAGGTGNATHPTGYAGGVALTATYALNVENYGTIAGGGGGGGAGQLAISPFTWYPGPGGAGFDAGAGSPNGSLTTGGINSTTGAKGGNLGQNGGTGAGGPITNYSGGAAGAAVVGNSYITWIATGTRLGAIT